MVHKLHKRYILKKGFPRWPIYLQEHSATQVCTGIWQNQLLFKIGHSPLIWKVVEHVNAQILACTCQSPGEIKSREVELGSHSWMDCLVAELFPNSSFPDTVFATLFRTAVETAVSKVHRFLRTGGVPTSSTLLFWRLTGRSAGTSYS